MIFSFRSTSTTFFLVISTLALPKISHAQQENFIKRTIKKFISSEKDSTGNGSFIILPAVGYAQETGLEYGIASTYNFFTDKSNPESRTSNLALSGTMTTKRQKNLKFNSDVWTKNNTYHILSEIRYKDWPFNFYGVGAETQDKDADLIDQKLIRIKIDAERKLASKFYAGVNINYDHLKFKDSEEGGIFDQQNVYGRNGGQFLALGLSGLYDNRNSTTYTTGGYYARLKYAYAPNFWKGDNYTGSQVEADIRGFQALSTKVTLGAQLIYRGTYGDRVPFYAMRELGGDMTMRGYYQGRYRDKNYATAQAELRYRFVPRFAVVGFAGTGSTFSKEHSSRFVQSYGGGVRYFFSLEHSSSIRLDYGYGEKRPGEARQKGFYLSISEAF